MRSVFDKLWIFNYFKDEVGFIPTSYYKIIVNTTLGRIMIQ